MADETFDAALRKYWGTVRGGPNGGPKQWAEQIDDAFKAGWAAHSHSLLAQWFAEWELILPPDARESFRNDLMPSVRAGDADPSKAPSEPVKDCHTCKYQHNAGSKGPCKSCTRLWAEVNGGRWDNWEPAHGVGGTDGR